MVYPKLSKTKAGYFYIPNDFMHPSLGQPLKKINNNVYGCPSIGGLNNRLFTLPSLLSVEIEFGMKLKLQTKLFFLGAISPQFLPNFLN